MARKKVVTRKIGRNAETGRFTSVEAARKQPKTHIVETLHYPPQLMLPGLIAGKPALRPVWLTHPLKKTPYDVPTNLNWHNI